MICRILIFIMFDACFMMSIEVAYAVRNYADYYMGCPTENPGPGAPYNKVVPYMFKQGAAVQMAEAYLAITMRTIIAVLGCLIRIGRGALPFAVFLKTSELDNFGCGLPTKYLQAGDATPKELRTEVFTIYDKRTAYNGHVGYF